MPFYEIPEDIFNTNITKYLPFYNILVFRLVSSYYNKNNKVLLTAKLGNDNIYNAFIQALENADNSHLSKRELICIMDNINDSDKFIKSLEIYPDTVSEQFINNTFYIFQVVCTYCKYINDTYSKQLLIDMMFEYFSRVYLSKYYDLDLTFYGIHYHLQTKFKDDSYLWESSAINLYHIYENLVLMSCHSSKTSDLYDNMLDVKEMVIYDNSIHDYSKTLYLISDLNEYIIGKKFKCYTAFELFRYIDYLFSLEDQNKNPYYNSEIFLSTLSHKVLDIKKQLLKKAIYQYNFRSFKKSFIVMIQELHKKINNFTPKYIDNNRNINIS